jgi:hypothetical protein
LRAGADQIAFGGRRLPAEDQQQANTERRKCGGGEERADNSPKAAAWFREPRRCVNAYGLKTMK